MVDSRHADWLKRRTGTLAPGIPTAATSNKPGGDPETFGEGIHRHRDRQQPDVDVAPGQRTRPSHPTVLVTSGNHELLELLASSLRADNCLVLDADTVDGLLEVIKVHSRPIHVLLLDAGLGDVNLAERLKQYRSGMQVVLMDGSGQGAVEDALSPDAALARVRLLLGIVRRALHA